MRVELASLRSQRKGKVMDMYDVILSGRIDGEPEYRVRFAQAVVKVRTKMPGAKVWNPAELESGREYKWYMRRCLHAIMEESKETCVLVLLKGWNRSLGAVAEWAVARCLGMPVVRLWEM